MRSDKRKGKIPKRSLRMGKAPVLGYYNIITDTKETEKNYFNGLRDSHTQCKNRNLVIQVDAALTKNLVEKAKEIRNSDPQYRKTWIVFDRDRVSNFDLLIDSAEKNGINVAWSNPCIEIWFHAYFGEMPITNESTKCVENFVDKYKQTTKQDYIKADKDIYKKLAKFGDETLSIDISKARIKQSCQNYGKPSEMFSTSTLHKLIEEIRLKTSS
ncbi:MAG: RloB domain-containing protein [Clostridiales bacterium]|nr:RloB domain-containing protein [Clostridiales bacterium]